MRLCDTEEILALAEKKKFSRRIPMWCDSAEPDRIKRWRRAGYNARGVKKESGSVRAQIDYLMGHMLTVSPRCPKKVPEGKMILTNKSAVRFFVKKEATLEQDKNIETKTNVVVYERHGLIALVDDTSSVIIGPAAEALNLAMTASAGECQISVGEELAAGHTYRVGIGKKAPLKGDDISAWPVWDGKAIKASAGTVIMIAECDADGRCLKCGVAIAS